MRIGLYGGTFDPPHVGHLAGASEAAAACGLESVVFMPAGEPWQKAHRPVSAAEHRYAMTLLATADRRDFVVSRLEIERPGPSFTADTLGHLAAGGHDVVFIAGADALSYLDTWERADEVRRLASFAVLRRPGSRIDEARVALAGAAVTEVDMPLIAVSSSDIRSRVATGRPISFLVSHAVEGYIAAHRLYSAAQ
jgi:nicotinate-nucleotide adenylyltransferase